jgi:hypothetical protein
VRRRWLAGCNAHRYRCQHTGSSICTGSIFNTRRGTSFIARPGILTGFCLEPGCCLEPGRRINTRCVSLDAGCSD